jgi:hypothetical protein
VGRRGQYLNKTDQKREAARRGDDVRLTLALFDSPVYSDVLGQLGYAVAYAAEKVTDVPPLTHETYVPGGATALLDAVDRTLDAVEEFKPADGELMVVMTDGQENASTKATKDAVKQRIADRQEAGWAVVYLGANVDEFAEAGSIGVRAGATTAWEATEDGATEVFARLSSSTTRFMVGESTDESFWADSATER